MKESNNISEEEDFDSPKLSAQKMIDNKDINLKDISLNDFNEDNFSDDDEDINLNSKKKR